MHAQQHLLNWPFDESFGRLEILNQPQLIDGVGINEKVANVPTRVPIRVLNLDHVQNTRLTRTAIVVVCIRARERRKALCQSDVNQQTRGHKPANLDIEIIAIDRSELRVVLGDSLLLKDPLTNVNVLDAMNKPRLPALVPPCCLAQS